MALVASGLLSVLSPGVGYGLGEVPIAAEAEFVVLHDPSAPDEVRGVDGVKEMIQAYRTAFGLRVTIEHQLANGDFVATRYTARGTHNAEFMGIPASGREGSAAGICISRFRDGKLVEEWDCWDALGVLQQIGALPVIAA